MSISFRCRCGKEYQVRDELAGRKASCKKCGEQITIPMPEVTELEAVDDLFPDLSMVGDSTQAGLPSSCPACLAEVPAGLSDCPKCGSSLAEPQATLPSYIPAPVTQKKLPTKPSQSKIDWSVFGGIVLKALPILGIVGLLLIMGIGGWRALEGFRADEAERQSFLYKGRDAEGWLKLIRKGSLRVNPEEFHLAPEKLRPDPAALPLLFESLTDERTDDFAETLLERYEVNDLVDYKSQLVSHLGSDDRKVVEMSLVSLATLGERARDSVSSIAVLISDEQNGFRAIEALGEVGGDDAVDALNHVLDDEHQDIKDHLAVDALGAIGGPRVVGIMRKILDDDSKSDFRLSAIEQLGKSGADALPTLQAILEDPPSDSLRAVLSAITNLGPDAEPALQQLRKIFEAPKNERFDSRWMAGEALVAIGPAAVDVFRAGLKDGDPDTREMTLRLISKLAPHAESANSCPACLAEVPSGLSACPQCDSPLAESQTLLPSYAPTQMVPKRQGTKPRKVSRIWFAVGGGADWHSRSWLPLSSSLP
ncbi:MAG: HEAT repeat domain-containing protein [Planctomycetota bacterium]|nr:HEAT repeat domain-containing protein [Planctomycetota bacterium]